MLLPFWGQLISHDMSLSAEIADSNGICIDADLGTNPDDDKCYNVDGVASCVDPERDGCEKCGFIRDGRVQRYALPLNRTAYCNDHLGVRQQLNKQTAFLDASVVYGTDKIFLDTNLKDPSDPWKMKSNKLIPTRLGQEFAPFDTYPSSHMICYPDPKTQTDPCFLFGDPRGNDVTDLNALQTILLREHNRIADRLKNMNGDVWSDEIIFEETRKILGAIIQKITYKDWLPEILDDVSNIESITSYEPSVDPSLFNGFSTAAMRFGHPMVRSMQSFRDPYYTENKAAAGFSSFYLYHALWSTSDFLKFSHPIEDKLRGTLQTYVKKFDLSRLYTNVLINDLFPRAYSPDQDLAARNVQRGREHGLPTLNKFRLYCNLSIFSNWGEFGNAMRDYTFQHSSDSSVTFNLLHDMQDLYGSPENIDFYVGGLLEKPLSDGLLGPTFNCILNEQFKRLKQGDRFFYSHPGVFTGDQRKEIEKYSLSKLMCNNFHDHPAKEGSQQIPYNAFHYHYKGGRPPYGTACCALDDIDLSKWDI